MHPPELVEEVPQDAFPGVADIQPCMQFQRRGQRGEINVSATRVEHVIAGNYRLAGNALRFAIEVVAVGDASADNFDHGHVHGAGGHNR